MRRRTSPGRVPSSRWPWTTSSSSCRRRHPGPTEPGGGLQGRDDEAGELPAGVEDGERVDHRHHRGAGVGDDVARPLGDLARVDLGDDERHVGVGAEDGAVVDGDDAAVGGELDPLAGDRWAGCRRSRRRRPRRTPASAPRPRRRRRRSGAPCRRPRPPRRAGCRPSGCRAWAGRRGRRCRRRPWRPRCRGSVARPPAGPSRLLAHVSGRCPRRRRLRPRRSRGRRRCARRGRPRRGGRRG